MSLSLLICSLLFSLIYISTSYNFNSAFKIRSNLNSLHAAPTNSDNYNAPTVEKSRLKVLCTGPSVNSALLRAEIKKGLVFYRGCECLYHYDINSNQLVLTAEGKTSKLISFMVILSSLSLYASSCYYIASFYI